MRGGPRILLGAPDRALGRERSGEALVERLPRAGDAPPQRLDEPLGLLRLRAALATEREGEPDDDELRVVLADEGTEPGQPGVRTRSLDDADGTRDRACGVGDGHA